MEVLESGQPRLISPPDQEGAEAVVAEEAQEMRVGAVEQVEPERQAPQQHLIAFLLFRDARIPLRLHHQEDKLLYRGTRNDT